MDRTTENFPALIGFKSRKAAQVAAFFAAKKESHIEKLALVKLIYLAERDFMSKYSHPMLYDEFFSLRNGPVCSSALNGINGQLDKSTWSHFIILEENKNVKAVKKFTREQHDEISDAEMEMLESTWTSFGWMTSAQIRDYTHKNCPEYTEIETGRLPIFYKDIFKALGKPNADELEEEINAYRRAESILGTQ